MGCFGGGKERGERERVVLKKKARDVSLGVLCQGFHGNVRKSYLQKSEETNNLSV